MHDDAPRKWPYFPLFAADFLTDTGEWSLEERGAHITLLCYQHINGDLPENRDRLARLLAISREDLDRLWNTLDSKYHPNGNGRMQNQKLETVKKDLRDYKKKKSEAGKKGAQARHGKADA